MRQNKIATVEEMFQRIEVKTPLEVSCRFGDNNYSLYNNDYDNNYKIVRLAETYNPSRNSFINAELLKHYAVYNLHILDAERDVAKKTL